MAHARSRGRPGDFINIGGAIGARLGYMGGAWRTQILLEEALQSPNLAAGVFFPPGDSMLQVNRYGKRVDEREAQLQRSHRMPTGISTRRKLSIRIT